MLVHAGDHTFRSSPACYSCRAPCLYISRVLQWGIFDGDTWVGTENAPLLYDTKFNPKPAYNAVLATLQAAAVKRGYKY